MVSRPRSILVTLMALWLLSIGRAHADGICICSPSVFGQINGKAIPPGTFTVIADAKGYTIDAELIDPSFQFAFHAATHPDPAVVFDLAISGDPTVQLSISQSYLGGPFSTFATAGVSGLSDGNGDGFAALTDAFVRTTVTSTGIPGSVVRQIDLNCVATGPAFFRDLPCISVAASQLTSQDLGIGDVSGGSLLVDIQFTLSDLDAATVNGSSVLSNTTAVPEPATGALFAAGLLTLGALGLRRRRSPAN